MPFIQPSMAVPALHAPLRCFFFFPPSLIYVFSSLSIFSSFLPFHSCSHIFLVLSDLQSSLYFKPDLSRYIKD